MTQLPAGSLDDGAEGKALIETTHPETSGRKNGRRRHWLGSWLLLLLGGSLGYFGGLNYLSKVPLQYTATVTLQVTPRTEDGRPGGRTDASDLRDLNTMAERIRRHDLLEKVASRQDVRDLKGLTPQTAIDWRPAWLDRFARNPSPPTPPSAVPDPAALAAMVSSWLKVSVRPGTWLIDISVTHPEPDSVPNLANAVARQYLAELYEERSQEVASERASYEGVLKLASELDEMEAERSKRQLEEASVAPDWAGFEAKINKQRARVLAGVLAVLCTGSDDSPVNTIFAAGSDERLGVARQLFDARLAELDLKLDTAGTESGSFSVKVSSLARTPGAPSSPDRAQALTLGTLGGLLLALLPVGLRGN